MTGFSGIEHNHNAIAHVQEPCGDGFIRIASPILDIGRAAKDGTVTIYDINVIIVSRRAHRISPEEIDAAIVATPADNCIVIKAPEVMHPPAPADDGAIVSCRSAILKVAFPSARTVSSEGSGIASGRKEQNPGGTDIIDGLGNRPVLKGRFIEINDVIDDDTTACGLEIADILSKTRYAIERCCEVQIGTGSKFMGDLKDGGTFAKAV